MKIVLSLFLSGFISSISLAQDSAERRAKEEDSRRASSIRSAAASIRSEAQRLRSQASSARSEAASVRGKASELDSEKAKTASRRSSMNGEISQLNSEASSLNSEATSLRREAASFRSQKAIVDAEIAKNNVALSDLLKVVYNFEKRVEFHEKENHDLRAVQEQLSSIQTNFDLLTSLQRRATNALNISSNLHAEWMKELEEVTAQLAPKFKDLKDSDSVAKAASAISAFEKKAPQPTRPNSAEDIALAIEREINSISLKIQQQLRDLSSMPGLAVYHKYIKTDYDGAFWKSMDESIHQNANLAGQFETLIKLFRERRVYLVRVIPLMWERMLNVRLDSIHLEKSVRTGQIAVEGLSLPDLIARSAQLDGLHNRAVRLFLELYSPLLASDQVREALAAAEALTRRLNELQVVSVSEARLALQARKVRLERLNQQLESVLQSKLEENLKTRRDSVVSESVGKSLSPSCEAKRAEVLNTPANRDNERAYTSFMESCL